MEKKKEDMRFLHIPNLVYFFTKFGNIFGSIILKVVERNAPVSSNLNPSDKNLADTPIDSKNMNKSIPILL